MNGRIFVKKLCDVSDPTNRFDAHRDNYFVFLMQKSGELKVVVDFKENTIQPHTMGFLLPGQIHYLIDAQSPCSYMLCIDPLLLEEELQHALFVQPGAGKQFVAVPPEEEENLAILWQMLERQSSEAVGKWLANSIVAMFVELMKPVRAQCTLRQGRLMSKFRQLLTLHIARQHAPSYYADAMGITVSSLSTIVKAATGWSVSKYIVKQLMLMAKRKLLYSADDIRHVAFSLGFTEPNYFNRVFMKEVGCTPTSFRLEHRKV